MPVIESDGKTIEVNEDGFLVRPAEWSRETAAVLARVGEGIAEMTPDHWKVVACIRAHYRDQGRAPAIRKLCQETGLPLKRIFELFPSGPSRGACKVAGVPKPEGCV